MPPVSSKVTSRAPARARKAAPETGASERRAMQELLESLDRRLDKQQRQLDALLARLNAPRAA
jgi:hypothetical protein